MAEETNGRELSDLLLGSGTYFSAFQLPKEILGQGQHDGRQVYPPMSEWERESEHLQDNNRVHPRGMLGTMAVCLKSPDWIRRRLIELSQTTVT